MQNPPAGSAAGPSDIAIIGMACRFPRADDLAEFWRNILNKVDAIEEIPADRWDWRLYFDADRQARDRVYSKWGGFMRPVHFDPTQYGMPPNAVPSVEPMQLIVLDVVRQAIADAANPAKPFDRERTCVVVGAGGGVADLGNGYGFRSLMPQYLADAGVPAEEAARIMATLNRTLPEWTEDSFAGILMNVVAGRVANRFDLGGTNFTVDAACASSLAAVRLAVNELETHSSDVAVVGGADTMQSPFAYLCFSKTQALSPNGRCKTFDASADGIVTSEGIAFVVLKRLADAERDGDRIYAVIKAVGASSDGKDKGLTAPRPAGQMRAMARAYEKAGIASSTISLVEAHGTGTVAGDRSEMESVSKMMATGEAAPQSCALGSVKSMIGHTKCTAGVAGLVKAALALHHRLLPATINVKNPNEAIANTPLYVNAETRPWMRRVDGTPRRAGVSSFGFGGTNFHAVLEEHTATSNGSAATPALRRWPVELFLFAGATADEALAQAEKIVRTIAEGAKPELTDLAAAVSAAADAATVRGRLAIAASSLEDLCEKIGHARAALKTNPAKLSDPRGLFWSAEPVATSGRVAFLFPGQGSQRVNMLRDLATFYPGVREYFERADAVLHEALAQPLSHFVYPPPRFNDAVKAADDESLTQTRVAQPAMGAADLAMFHVLAELGIRPQMAAGHSYGEYAALCAAGAMTFEELMQVSEARGRIVAEAALSAPGAMAAVEGDEATVAGALKGLADVVLANLNSPRQTVISGTEAGIDAATKRLAEQGLTARRIKVSCAFHSRWIAAAQSPLAAALEKVPFATANFPVYSNTTAAPHAGDGAAMRRQLVDHLVQPVRFVDEVRRMYEDGARVFIEVGPGTTLTALAERCLEGRGCITVATDPGGKHGLTGLVHALGTLAAAGVAFDSRRLFAGRVDRALDLEKLAEQTQPAAPSATTWIVTGTRAVPLNGKKPKTVEAAPAAAAASAAPVAPPITAPAASAVAQPKSVLPPQAVSIAAPPPPSAAPVASSSFPGSVAPVAFSGAVTPPAGNVLSVPPTAATPAPLAATPAPITRVAAVATPVAPMSMEASDSVIGDFQRMMAKFLDTQKSVMLAYLQGGGQPAQPAIVEAAAARPALTQSFAPAIAPASSPIVASPVFAPVAPPSVAAPFVPQPPPVAPVPAAMPAPAAVPAAAPRTSRETILNRLIAVVSDRTGYPPEMLNAQLDLEADLGIDSIKRVEILGTLRNEAMLPADAAEGAMEALSKLKTIDAIVDWIVARMGDAPAAVPATTTSSAPAAADATGVSRKRLVEHLVQVVSDRTGYPPEMLNLDLDLEADLGIDSIKRVEILGSLRSQAVLPGESAEAAMEQLAKLKTLNAIIAWIMERAPSAGAAPASSAMPVTANPARSATAASTGLTREKLVQHLVQVVSDRTGYPPEMLNLDLDLEADLGIDSIKRVEVLGTLRNESMLPADAAEGAMEQLAKLKTLNAIIDWILERAASALPTSAAAAPAVAAPTAANQPVVPQIATGAPLAAAPGAVPSSLPRMTLSVRDLKPDDLEPLVPGGLVLITDDEGGISNAVSMLLQSRGIRSAIVAARRHPAENGDTPRLDLTDATAVGGWIAGLKGQHGRIAGLIHLLPLAPDAISGAQDPARRAACLDHELLGLAHLAQHLESDLRGAGDGVVLTVSRLDGSFGCASIERAFDGWHGHAAAGGIVKSLAREWPDVRCRALDFAPDAAVTLIAENIVTALLARRAPSEIGFSQGRARLLLPTPSRLEGRGGSLQLTRDDVIVITGGARGITAEVAAELSRRFQSTLVLIGRSALPVEHEPADTAGLTTARDLKTALARRITAEGRTAAPADIEAAYRRLLADRDIRASLAAMRQAGSAVHYVATDVADAAAFAAAIEGIYARFGRIDGVIHAAGVTEDKFLRDKTDASFRRVLAPKVQGATVLAETLRSDSLKFLFFFSSVSARYGNRGQSDYAAANEFMNKLALRLNAQWPGRVASLGWGPWESTGGMVSAELAEQFAKSGVRIISRPEGRAAFIDELMLGYKDEVEVIFGGPLSGPDADFAARLETPQVLLHGRTAPVKQADGSVVFEYTIDPALDLYLLDHRLDGKPVMPAAMSLELLAEAVSTAYPDRAVVAVRDLKVLSGIVIENGPRAIRATVGPVTVKDGRTLASVRVDTAGERSRLCYSGMVELGNPVAPPVRRAFAATNPRPLGMTVEEAYERWLFHGALFAGIDTVESLGDNGIIATLTPSSPRRCLASGNGGAWLFDPVLVDSGLQMMILWARTYLDMTPLPAKFGRMERFDRAWSGPIRCEVEIRRCEGPALEADLAFRNSASELVGLLSGMEVTCSKALNRLSASAAETASSGGQA